MKKRTQLKEVAAHATDVASVRENVSPDCLLEIRQKITELLDRAKTFKKPLIATVVRAAFRRHAMAMPEIQGAVGRLIEEVFAKSHIQLTDMQGTRIGTKRPPSKKHRASKVKRVRRGVAPLDFETLKSLEGQTEDEEPTTAPIGSLTKVHVLAARYQRALKLRAFLSDNQTLNAMPLSDEEELAQRMALAAKLNRKKPSVASYAPSFVDRIGARFSDRLSKKSNE